MLPLQAARRQIDTMMLRAFAMHLFRSLGVFWRSKRAVAAVEFALVLPFALALYVGAAEVADGVMTSRKVSTVTRTLVDLTSQQQTSSQLLSVPAPPAAVPATTLSTLMTAAATLLYPEPTGALKMTLSAIDVANTSAGVCCTATVRWSFTQGGTLRPCAVNLSAGADGATGQLTTFPTDLMPVGTPLPSILHFIVADVSYVYQPIMSTKLLNFMPSMARTEYMMPRSVGQVITGSLPASGAQVGQVCY